MLPHRPRARWACAAAAAALCGCGLAAHADMIDAVEVAESNAGISAQLAGCWSGLGDRFQVSDDNGQLTAADGHGDLWSGRIDGDVAVFTLRFRSLQHYLERTYGATMDTLSDQEVARVEVLADAGVSHVITLSLPAALADAETLDGVFLETPVAEPLNEGPDNRAFIAVDPAEAVLGNVFGLEGTWTRDQSCGN